MNHPLKTSALAAALLIALGAVGYGGYRLGTQHSAPAAMTASGDAKIDPASGRRVLYWHDPMVPGQRFDKPGKSPFMDMQLVPVYADAGGDDGGISVSARQTQSLGLRTATVSRATLAPQLDASGSVDWNERGLTVIQARNTGFVEKLFVRATLDRVAKGQPLAELYVPDWIAAQEEFLAVTRMQGDTAALVDAARARMRQAGMSDALIAQVEKSGRVQTRITLTAPAAGSVVEIAAREGMTVSAGSTLFRLNALDSVWVNAAVPESQAALLRPGMAVEASAAGFPEQRFQGRVQAILPEVEAATRTLKVRIELANPGARLSPGMFVRITFGAAAREVLQLPAEALIRTGRRTVVMLAEGEGRYRPVEVETGQEAAGMVEIRKGLDAGQQVVVSGQFLLDSEASLRATGTRLAEPAASAPVLASARTHEVMAVFESLVDDMAMISHPPIPELKWGAMTMGFRLPKEGWPKDIAPGAKVHIAFIVPESGEPQLTHVMKVEGGK
ncbi:efflux RND transporter periplasmic adaptor subunit [Uliginosibacterium paludis]|uniref:Efflux RND transporter periplasmic adaptor subunit n=1 Tax=Uliginosibacterium paludis TaxID=1615952 RepID=A0ABV2CSI3_9RHOO